MRCRQCGCNNPDGAQICVGCGGALSPEILSVIVSSRSGAAAELAIETGNHPAVALGYATMGERFLASLCDGSVETLLIGAFLAVSYWKFSMSFDGLKQIALWLTPPAYMIVSECLFHRTLGKWLLQIQVRRDSEEPRYPSPWKILIRESIGKFLSGLILGIGFLAGAFNAQKKTWHDHIAGTVVVRTGVARAGIKAVLVPILVVMSVWMSVELTELHTRLAKNISAELIAIEGKVDDVYAEIVEAIFVPDPRSTSEYQQDMKALTPTLDEYDRLLDQQVELMRRLQKLDGSAYIDEELTYPRIVGLRRDIAELVRRQVQKAIAFDAKKQAWKDLLKDRHEMMREINFRNNQINQIGGKYLVRKTVF